MTDRNPTSGSMAVTGTDLPGIPIFRKGKVRDVYDLGENLLKHFFCSRSPCVHVQLKGHHGFLEGLVLL